MEKQREENRLTSSKSNKKKPWDSTSGPVIFPPEKHTENSGSEASIQISATVFNKVCDIGLNIYQNLISLNYDLKKRPTTGSCCKKKKKMG